MTSQRTLLDALAADGITLPPPGDLDDAAVTDKLWQAIHGLAARKLYLTSTDHLSDRELYEILLGDILLEEDEPVPDWGTGSIIDVLDIDDPDGLVAYLRYYADDMEREGWTPDDLPDGYDELPAREAMPYDRDRKLPSGIPPRRQDG